MTLCSLRSEFLEEFLARIWGEFLDTCTRAVAVQFVLLKRTKCAGAGAK